MPHNFTRDRKRIIYEERVDISQVIEDRCINCISRYYPGILMEYKYVRTGMTLCVPVHRNQLCKRSNKMHLLYIYLFHNFHIHSTCFERSSRSSSGVYHTVLYYTHSSVQSCECVQLLQSYC